MSGGVNLKTMSQSGSGIPLPRSLSKRDTRGLSGALLGPAAQNQLAGRTSTLSSSASSISSLSISKELLRGSSQGTHGTSGCTNRPSFAPLSAHSSPHVPRRETLSFKNNLRRGSLPQDGFRDMERHSNKNWRSGRHHFRSLDNEVVESSREQQTGQALRKPTNGNVIWETSAAVQRDFQKQRMEMLARGYSNRGTIASKSQVNGTNACPPGRESPRMAAVAPFRYRLQVGEDTEASLEDLSDCSSDSVEVCCEDLGNLVSSSCCGVRGGLAVFMEEGSRYRGESGGRTRLPSSVGREGRRLLSSGFILLAAAALQGWTARHPGRRPCRRVRFLTGGRGPQLTSLVARESLNDTFLDHEDTSVHAGEETRSPEERRVGLFTAAVMSSISLRCAPSHAASPDSSSAPPLSHTHS
ncbi:hypothetical protein cypCar_00037388 [Cyprinus carpio]|nr:hypothetical protein cypCar_00037388 [Cyprinus carpio]